MSITITSPFKARPRISRAGFIAVLQRVGSYSSDPLWEPTANDERPAAAGDLYDYIVSQGHDPAVYLAIAGKEHTFGTNMSSVLGRNHTRSWTNARSVRHPDVKGEIILDSYRRSYYVRYEHVLDSVRDGVYRVDDPNFAYQQAGAETIAEVIAIWAPADDANNPEGYAQTMARWINEWGAEFPPEQEQPVSVAEKYGIRGLIDSRQDMARNAQGGPTNRRSLSQKQGVVVHYAGGPQNHSLTDMQLWQAYANWHVRANGFGQGHTGNGIMYHIGIGRDGSKHLLYDIEVDRWHCGSWPENGTHLAINLPIGGTQRATPNALQALREVVHDWIANGHGTRQMVIGHQEVDWTACPGTLMSDFVVPYRNQEAPVANYIHFPETGHGIGHGFLDFWQSKGGLMVFGYPLSDELDEEVMLEDRKKTVTVQYFERAVFEFHSDHQEPYRILLRRLGADALNRKRSA